MKPKVLAEKKLRSNGLLMNDIGIQMNTSYVVCIKNDGYEAALELRKIYQMVLDLPAEKDHLIRVIDETGEDYLYPDSFFAAIDLPEAIVEAFASSAG
jgi:hypothetical protein